MDLQQTLYLPLHLHLVPLTTTILISFIHPVMLVVNHLIHAVTILLWQGTPLATPIPQGTPLSIVLHKALFAITDSHTHPSRIADTART